MALNASWHCGTRPPTTSGCWRRSWLSTKRRRRSTTLRSPVAERIAETLAAAQRPLPRLCRPPPPCRRRPPARRAACARAGSPEPSANRLWSLQPASRCRLLRRPRVRAGRALLDWGAAAGTNSATPQAWQWLGPWDGASGPAQWGLWETAREGEGVGGRLRRWRRSSCLYFCRSRSDTLLRESIAGSMGGR